MVQYEMMITKLATSIPEGTGFQFTSITRHFFANSKESQRIISFFVIQKKTNLVPAARRFIADFTGTCNKGEQKPKRFCREHFDGCDVFRAQ